MLRDFLKLIAQMIKLRAGGKLLGRFLVLQGHDLPKRKLEEEKKRNYLLNQGNIIHRLLMGKNPTHNDHHHKITPEEAHILDF
jgi:hypothetical protein